MSGATPPLEALGPRIIILGASNAGKSTLAEAIARKARSTPVFLDQLRFVANSDWVERPDADFTAEAKKLLDWDGKTYLSGGQLQRKLIDTITQPPEILKRVKEILEAAE